jgi:hypothetical protein
MYHARAKLRHYLPALGGGGIAIAAGAGAPAAGSQAAFQGLLP